MQRVSYSQKFFTSKRKANSLKFADNDRKSSKVQIRIRHDHKKIPKIINQIQYNLMLLKKYYQEEEKHTQVSQGKDLTRRLIRPTSSNIKCKAKNNKENFVEQQTTVTVPELDDLKKSFLSMHGYDTNNVVELYNFYKKNMEKSTRLFGSTSMLNVVNITNNHSEIRQKGMRPNSAFVTGQEQNQIKQKQQINNCVSNDLTQDTQKLPFIKSQVLQKKSNDMISVANLLADKKKVSRRNICENMNTDNLTSQAKRRLYRPNPNQNMQKSNKLKQNIKCDNIRVSPSKKLKNQSQKDVAQAIKKMLQIKQKSNSQYQQIFIQKQNNNNLSKNQIIKQDFQEIKLKEKSFVQNKQKVAETEAREQKEVTQSIVKKIEQIQSNEQKQVKLLKSAKSQKSMKSIKSPNSFRSPSLNRGVILDSSSGQQSQRKNLCTYFVPRVHPSNHDSLLDCQITPKDQSKLIDLQSIPFDF